MRTHRSRLVPLAVASFALATRAAALAAAPQVAAGAGETRLFSISKSENRNEVVYAVHLDDGCAPVGDAPVYAFWRMRERGEAIVEPLLSREEAAYGIARQRVAERGSNGGELDIALRALPGRPIRIQTQKQDGVCRAWSTTPIAGTDAHLYNVYVKLRFLGVDYLLLSGWSIDGRQVVREQVRP
jgi:hypothetical protein